MSRRVSLPAADDLFRPTGAAPADDTDAATAGRNRVKRAVASVPDPEVEANAEPKGRRTSGRVRHDEKMTVYITSDELLEIEHARLMLRKMHGLAVDRGRLVRQAVAFALADLEENGEQSHIVERLRDA